MTLKFHMGRRRSEVILIGSPGILAGPREVRGSSSTKLGNSTNADISLPFLQAGIPVHSIIFRTSFMSSRLSSTKSAPAFSNCNLE